MLVCVYDRVSRDELDVGIEQALESHRAQLERLAEQNGFTEIDWYQEVVSGGLENIEERPQLALMLSRIEQYSVLLTLDIDRLARNQKVLETIKRVLLIHQITIITPNGTIDLDNQNDGLLFSVRGLLSEFELAQISKRLRDGKYEALCKGLWVHNKTPLGYDRGEDKRLVINESEAEIIRFIFNKSLENMSLSEMQRQIYARGWRSRNGNVIFQNAISFIRENITYMGTVHAKKLINKRLVDETFVEEAHEPIIDPDLFYRVQALIEENRTDNVFNKPSKHSLRLDNLVYCKTCGRKKYFQQAGVGGNFYIKKCPYQIGNNPCSDSGTPYSPIESYVLERVRLKRSEFENALHQLELQDVSALQDNLLKEKSSLEKQTIKLASRIRNYAVMRGDGEITKQEFEELRTDAENSIKQLEQQLKLIDIKLNNLSNTEPQKDELRKILSDLDNLESLDIHATNRFLHRLIKKVHIHTPSNLCSIEWREYLK